MTGIPSARRSPSCPEDGLRGHAEALRERADRLRGACDLLDWKGPQADTFRARVEELAQRCATAAEGLSRSADRFEDRA